MVNALHDICNSHDLNSKEAGTWSIEKIKTHDAFLHLRMVSTGRVTVQARRRA